MHISERELSRRRELAPVHPAQQTRAGQILHEPPRTRWRTFNILVRAETTPLLVLSFAVGAILAWWETSQVYPLALGIGVLGAITAGWAFNAFSDYCADQYKKTAEAQAVQDPLYTGIGLIRRGIVPRAMVRDIVLLLIAIFAVCIVWLTWLAGWPILYFAILGVLASAAVLLLPFISGYRSWGIGHIGTMLILGMFPVLSGYYGQAHGLSSASLWSALLFTMIIGLVQYNYDAINLRRDWLIGKPTLAVNLGAVHVRDVSTLFTIGVYLALLALVTLTDVPLVGLVALLAMPMALGVMEPMQQDEVSADDCILLYSSALNSTALTGLLLCAAIVITMLV